jgi:chitosanase
MTRAGTPGALACPAQNAVVIPLTGFSLERALGRSGSETTDLYAFLGAHKAAMLTEAAHDDTRVDVELNPPLKWRT